MRAFLTPAASAARLGARVLRVAATSQSVAALQVLAVRLQSSSSDRYGPGQSRRPRLGAMEQEPNSEVVLALRGSDPDFGRALWVIRTDLTNGRFVNSKTFSYLFRKLERHGDASVAWEALQLSRRAGCNLDTRMLSTLLLCFAINKHAPGVHHMAAEVRNAPGLVPDFIYTRLLHAYMCVGAEDHALRLLDACRAAGLPMGPLVSNLLLSAFEAFPLTPWVRAEEYKHRRLLGKEMARHIASRLISHYSVSVAPTEAEASQLLRFLCREPIRDARRRIDKDAKDDDGGSAAASGSSSASSASAAAAAAAAASNSLAGVSAEDLDLEVASRWLELAGQALAQGSIAAAVRTEELVAALPVLLTVSGVDARSDASEGLATGGAGAGSGGGGSGGAAAVAATGQSSATHRRMNHSHHINCSLREVSAGFTRQPEWEAGRDAYSLLWSCADYVAEAASAAAAAEAAAAAQAGAAEAAQAAAVAHRGGKPRGPASDLPFTVGAGVGAGGGGGGGSSSDGSPFSRTQFISDSGSGSGSGSGSDGSDGSSDAGSGLSDSEEAAAVGRSRSSSSISDGETEPGEPEPGETEAGGITLDSATDLQQLAEQTARNDMLLAAAGAGRGSDDQVHWDGEGDEDEEEEAEEGEALLVEGDEEEADGAAEAAASGVDASGSLSPPPALLSRRRGDRRPPPPLVLSPTVGGLDAFTSHAGWAPDARLTRLQYTDRYVRITLGVYLTIMQRTARTAASVVQQQATATAAAAAAAAAAAQGGAEAAEALNLLEDGAATQAAVLKQLCALDPLTVRQHEHMLVTLINRNKTLAAAQVAAYMCARGAVVSDTTALEALCWQLWATARAGESAAAAVSGSPSRRGPLSRDEAGACVREFMSRLTGSSAGADRVLARAEKTAQRRSHRHVLGAPPAPTAAGDVSSYTALLADVAQGLAAQRGGEGTEGSSSGAAAATTAM